MPVCTLLDADSFYLRVDNYYSLQSGLTRYDLHAKLVQP